MTTLWVAYAPEDTALADRLMADFREAGYTMGDSPPEAGESILIAVISAAGKANSAVEGAITQALDKGQPIVPVLKEETALPKLINHLSAVNFSQDYDFGMVRGLVDAVSAPGAGRPLKVLTPSVRAANRRFGVWLTILVLISFIIGVFLIGFYGIQAPRDEYNSIDTMAAVTVQALIAPNLPRTTEDAANFPMTVQAAPTAQRPLLVATATALAERSRP